MAGNSTAAAPGDVKVEALARLLNLTPRRVQQLAREGVIPKSGRGLYPFVPAIRAYMEYLQQANLEQGDVDPDRLKPFERKAHYDAEYRKMEVQKKHGELISREELEPVLFQWVDIMMSFIEVLPDRGERDGYFDRTQAARVGDWIDALREELFEKLVAEGFVNGEISKPD